MNTHKKNIVVKVLAAIAAAATGIALGMSGLEAAMHIVDIGFLKAGKEPVKCFMKNPDAKFFKGYRIFDPVTGITKKVSKKKFYEVMSSIPSTKMYVKTTAGVVIGILTVAGITKVLYSEYTKKTKLGDTVMGQKLQAMAAKKLAEDDSNDEEDVDDIF
jgi:hypothetical protein